MVDFTYLPQAKAPICPYCNQKTRLTTGLEVHPNNIHYADCKYWLCSPCAAYVGCHAGTETALGIPADRPTRLARQKLHVIIDDLWKNAPKIYNLNSRKPASSDALIKAAIKRARNRVYAWLTFTLNIESNETHIGLFDIDTCAKAMTALDQVTYSKIREWAREVEGMHLAALIDAATSPVTSAVGLTLGVTGPKTEDAEDVYRDTAKIWLNLAHPKELLLKLNSSLDVGFAEAASDIGLPFSIVMSPNQKRRSNETRLQAVVIAAKELYIIDDGTNSDPWTAIRRNILVGIDALAIIPTKSMDPLTRSAHDKGKIIFNIRRDLVKIGCWSRNYSEFAAIDQHQSMTAA